MNYLKKGGHLLTSLVTSLVGNIEKKKTRDLLKYQLSCMITLKEILKDKDYNKLDKEIQDNLTILLEKINKVRTLYGKPMTVSSGLRTKEDQIRVYKEKAAKAGTAFDESKVPMGSQHLYGAALDIFDPKKELQKWCLDNEKKLEEFGLWMESFTATPNWCHFQIKPYRSWKQGKSIFFNP